MCREVSFPTFFHPEKMRGRKRAEDGSAAAGRAAAERAASRGVVGGRNSKNDERSDGGNSAEVRGRNPQDPLPLPPILMPVSRLLLPSPETKENIALIFYIFLSIFKKNKEYVYFTKEILI